MLEAVEIIKKVKSAKKLADVIDVTKLKSEFNNAIKKIHPDVCKDKDAVDATAKLNKLKEEFVDGIKYRDDAGDFVTNGYSVQFSGDESVLKKSIANYKVLKSFKGNDAIHFHKYMPFDVSMTGSSLEIKFEKRAIPLVNLSLPQEHVNWILSRLLEFSAWLEQVGYVHCGINPESIFIVPETHGIQVCSFYHMTKLNGKAKTASGKYLTWYPPSLMSTKKATANIDTELSKKLAIYLLGDRSGSGIKLKKTHNAKFIDFAITQHDNAHEAYDTYRKMLAKNFEKKFHILNI